MGIICICNQKGGVGKSTTAAALAQAAVYTGHRALLIDADPQGNATLATGADAGRGNSYQLLTGTPAADLIQTTAQGVDVIPAAPDLSTITSGKGTARRLQRALKPLQGRYNMILIDTPSTAGELQYNGLQAATRLIIPLQADIFNLQSLYQTAEAARQIQQSNPALKDVGFILTQFDARSTIARQMRDTITGKAEAMGVQYLGSIRAAVAVKEAQALQQSLFDYAPKSKPAADYMELYTTLTQEV